MHSDGTLSVQAVTEKDAGDYLCITRNRVADDYRLLRVSVATKPAKIEPRQPLNHLVSLGKTLKVDSHIHSIIIFSNMHLFAPQKYHSIFFIPLTKHLNIHNLKSTSYLFCSNNTCLVYFIVRCDFKCFSSFKLCHFYIKMCFFYTEGL